MSYEKQTWTNGDVITADKLNHLEDGVYNNSQSGGVLCVNASYNDQTGIMTLDKTYTEIKTAIDAGTFVTVIPQIDSQSKNVWFVASYFYSNFAYRVGVFVTDKLANQEYQSPILVFSSITADGVLSFSVSDPDEH